MRGSKYPIYGLICLVLGFCLLCGWLVIDSGLFDSCGRCILLQTTTGDPNSSTEDAPPQKTAEIKADESISFRADDAPPAVVVLGARDPNTEDPESGFKFRLELTSKGAAIRKAIFSNGNNKGFDNRDPKNPQPLVVISPSLGAGGAEILTMANTYFVFDRHGLQLALDRLHWRSSGVETTADGAQTARFEALIKNKQTNEPVVKLVKTYTVSPNSYLLNCDLTVENLSPGEQKVRFDLTGPGGLNREGFRSDMRNVVTAFRDPQGQIAAEIIEIKKFDGKQAFDEKLLAEKQHKLVWIAATNKYFGAILRPVPEGDKKFCEWIPDSLEDQTGRDIHCRMGRLYNPDAEKNSGDENLGLYLRVAPNTLAARDQAGSARTYKFQLYIGPKDKSLFDKNKLYRELRFVESIDFLGCCCPASIIKPLAFGILATMKWMYGFIGNYGVVIIILVFCVRLIMHPVTKKSQVSMSKMQKLAPRVEEIKKKYANNKAEMNKQMMALYKEQGASPIMGLLPMMVQMPIWIALWSAVYSSIDLRGAPFLPFWITDLSVPDALFRFPAVSLPLLGKLDSFNLLPLLMGLAFYLQQKLMPKQAGAANPQVAQQQKMMMIMMPLLFPLMLYKAPSGVNLYIMSSTFAGVIEQYFIRKHIREKDDAESKGRVAVTSKTGGKVKKKKPKPFFKT